MATEQRRRLSRSRYLIRPCGLAGSRWEAPAAGLYSLALSTVFTFEILTPDDVLAALGLPPLLAAIWTLSGILAGIVSLLALALFGVVLAKEPGNRVTLICVAGAGLLIAIALRLYATSLAEVLSARRHHRLPPAAFASPTLAAGVRLYGIESLTRREIEVARLASEGYMASEIGDRLQISERTVESHLAHAYTKLGVNSRGALIRIRAKLARQDKPADLSEQRASTGPSIRPTAPDGS
jgi:DNA-binding CsgD family transcriptional regulator